MDNKEGEEPGKPKQTFAEWLSDRRAKVFRRHAFVPDTTDHEKDFKVLEGIAFNLGSIKRNEPILREKSMQPVGADKPKV